MDKCKELLLKNGKVFLTKASQAREKIAKIASSWLPNGAVRDILKKLESLNL